MYLNRNIYILSHLPTPHKHDTMYSKENIKKNNNNFNEYFNRFINIQGLQILPQYDSQKKYVYIHVLKIRLSHNTSRGHLE